MKYRMPKQDHHGRPHHHEHRHKQHHLKQHHLKQHKHKYHHPPDQYTNLQHNLKLEHSPQNQWPRQRPHLQQQSENTHEHSQRYEPKDKEARFRQGLQNGMGMRDRLKHRSGGQTLRQWLDDRRSTRQKLNQLLVTRWIIQLAFGLEQLYRQNYIHTDLTPENIIVDHHLDLKIINCQSQPPINNLHSMLYWAPEQLLSSGTPPCPKTNMWSLGCIAYQLCSLQTIHSNILFDLQDISPTLLYKSISANNPKQIPRGYSQQLNQLIKQMLQLDASKRTSINSVLNSPLITYTQMSLQTVRHQSYRLREMMHRIVGYRGKGAFVKRCGRKYSQNQMMMPFQEEVIQISHYFRHDTHQQQQQQQSGVGEFEDQQQASQQSSDYQNSYYQLSSVKSLSSLQQQLLPSIQGTRRSEILDSSFYQQDRMNDIPGKSMFDSLLSLDDEQVQELNVQVQSQQQQPGHKEKRIGQLIQEIQTKENRLTSESGALQPKKEQQDQCDQSDKIVQQKQKDSKDKHPALQQQNKQ